MPTYDTSKSVSMAIVDDVAEKEGVHPLELEPPLQAVVDTDALTNLCDGESSKVIRVEFQYHGYEITVKSDGRVAVDQY